MSEAIMYEKQPERKSYLHRQRPGENETPVKDREIYADPGQSSPDTPDAGDARMATSSSQATRRSRARPLSSAASSSKPQSLGTSPATSLNQAKTGPPAPSSQGQGVLNARANPSLERVASFDRLKDISPASNATSKRSTPKTRDPMMSTQDSVKMQGQDTLEVRNVTLPNGHSASLVLEDGKLQRVVSSSGNVVEVHWQGGRMKEPKGGPERQMAIKLRSATNLQENDAGQANQPGTFRKLTNSLHSQRLSSAGLNSLFSGTYQPGMFTKSDKDMRSIRSMDFSDRRRAGSYRQKQEPARTASQGDMSTIFEATPERKAGVWNPIGASWLPSNMTARQSGEFRASPSPSLGGNTPGGGTSVAATPRVPASGAATPQAASRSTSLGKTPKSSNASKKETTPEKKKIWQTIKDFFRIGATKKNKSPEKSSTPETTRMQSLSAGVAGASPEGMAVKEDPGWDAGGPRASAPPAPINRSLSAELDSLPAEDDTIVATDAQAAQTNRSTAASNADTNDYSQISARRPVAGGLTTGSAPMIPVSSSIIPRQYRFGPDTPTTPVKTEPTEEDKTLKPKKRSLNTPTHSREIAAPANSSLSGRDSGLLSRNRTGNKDFAPMTDVVPKHRTAMAGHWQRDFTQGTSGGKVDELLNVSTLQRLAREKTMEMQIIETDATFEMKWHIPLNGSSSKISKVDRYLKNGEVVEGARRDGRAGVLRSQLTFTPEGHVHIRALQGAPYSAVFHDRLKVSSGGRRIKIEQKFQLLEPGVPPVKHFSIWQRVE